MHLNDSKEARVNDAELLVMMMVIIILAGVAVLWMAMHNRRLIRELEHRERIAMIERGLIPSPEVDPAGFERHTGLIDEPQSRAAARARSAGVIMIGFGLAMLMLISFAAETPSVGIGIGGAFALLGAAFLFNSMLMGRRDSHAPLPPLGRPVSRPPESHSRPSEPPDQSRHTTL
jgi:hypothetical protein